MQKKLVQISNKISNVFVECKENRAKFAYNHRFMFEVSQQCSDKRNSQLKF